MSGCGQNAHNKLTFLAEMVHSRGRENRAAKKKTSKVSPQDLRDSGNYESHCDKSLRGLLILGQIE